jgi:hypothetical protein
MAHFGGSTYLGGGAVCGGGGSYYESWRDQILEWFGVGPYAKNEDDVIWEQICVMAGQFEGAQVDAERIVSEGLPAKAVETLEDWETICDVRYTVDSQDARRNTLLHLSQHLIETVTAARAELMVEAILESTGSGLSTSAYDWQCSWTQAQADNNLGDGVRYWCVTVPEWTWDEQWRDYYYQMFHLFNRVDPTICEYSQPVGGPAAPIFLIGISLVDRDVVG